jgi:hypothetical protein
MAGMPTSCYAGFWLTLQAGRGNMPPEINAGPAPAHFAGPKGEDMKMHHFRPMAVALGFCLAISLSARANSGTQIPLSQYQAGTEQTAPNIVVNGSFENLNSGAPINWLQDGNMRVFAPQNPPPINPAAIGTLSAQALTNQPTAPPADNYHYTTNNDTAAVLTFDPNQFYMLSAYMWNFGLDDPAPANPFVNGDLALVELKDPTDGSNLFNLTLEGIGSTGDDGANGFFVYDVFKGDKFPNGATLDVRGDLDENLSSTRPDVYAQFDNIVITPVPEPAALALLALVLPLSRRR